MPEAQWPEDLKRAVLKHALANAVKHGGKASPGPVMNKILGEFPDLRQRARDVAQLVREVVDRVNSMAPEEQERVLRELEPEAGERGVEMQHALPPLPGAERGVVTRFAPNPDFVLHLGNARPALLSYLYSKEMYRGKMILRLEDTDPRTKTPMPEAYWAIKEDLRWLGIRWDEEYIQSLRMEIYYRTAKELIIRGGAYVDLCSREEFARARAERRSCPHRLQGADESLELFEKMILGFFGEGEAVVRVRTDLDHPDPSVVDWVAFRIIDTGKTPHPLVGDRYTAWPTYNFAAGVDDHLLGVTHILRGREHVQNTTKQQYIYKHMGWDYPHVINLGRLRLEGFILSKSGIRDLLSRKPERFKGFSDPRFGTLAGLRERGILAETVVEIIRSLGVKPSDASISWDNVASLNRKKLDPRARRIMFVPSPTKIYIEGIPESAARAEAPYHPDNRGLGSRTLELGRDVGGFYAYASSEDLEAVGAGGRLRLMELANIEILGRDGEKYRARFLSQGVDDARRAGMPIIQWCPGGSLKAVLREPRGLGYRVVRGLVEPSVKGLGDPVFQLVRVGFAKVLSASAGVVEMLKIHS